MPTLVNVSIKDDANWSTFLDMIYPVGSYYISNSSTTPASRFGGTWTQVTSRFLYGSTSITTGGSNNAIIVSHNHSASTASAGSHTHSSGSGRDFVSHITNTNNWNANMYIARGGTSNAWYSYHNATASAGAHTHTVTVSSKGESGTNKNMPQYRTAFM